MSQLRAMHNVCRASRVWTTAQLVLAAVDQYNSNGMQPRQIRSVWISSSQMSGRARPRRTEAEEHTCLLFP